MGKEPGNIMEPPQDDKPKIEEGKQKFPLLVRSGLSFLFEVAKVVIISLAIIIPIRYFLFQPFYVKGASMEPNFHDNEYLIINQIDYRFHDPQRGDVIVLRYPRDPSQFFIKRVIGLPGEHILVRGGHVTITNAANPEGFTLDESPYLDGSVTTVGGPPVDLGTNEYFVLGDNRPASLDSRSVSLGPVPRSAIIGKAWFRVWPFAKFRVFHAPAYAQS